MNRNVVIPYTNILLKITIAITVGSMFGPVDAMASAADMYRRGFIALEPEYVIGGENADDENTLYLVLGYDIDSKGSLFVADMKLNCIKEFDSSGSHVLTFGREGEGPGDFRAPAALAIGRSDDLIINDSGNGRIQQLTTNGKHIKSVYITDGFLSDIEVGPVGGYYAAVQESQIGPPTSPQKLELIRLDDGLSVVNTIDEMSVQMTVIVGTADNYAATGAPYPPSLEWAVLPDGRLVVGHSDTNKLRILSPSGELLRTLTLKWDPPPVTDTERNKYFAAGSVDLQTYREGFKEAIEFPEHMPYYSDITVDTEGNILVRWAIPVDGKTLYHVFDGNGNFISRVTMDIYPEDVKFRDGLLYARHGVFPTELPTIRRYRIK
jgi:hypothetical protein